jgi:ABC-2 type transport system permease protein
MLRTFAKYGKILRISLSERLVYRADFFVSTIFRFLPLVTSFLLWQAVFNSLAAQREREQREATPSAVAESQEEVVIGGFTRDTTIAYLLLVQISRMFSSMPGLASSITRDIRDGNLKKYLLQPIDMQAYLLASRGAHKLAYIVTSALPYALLFWYFHDVFPGWPDPLTFFAYVLSLLLGFVIGFFFEATVGMVGFWMLEVTSLLYIINAVNYFVSGQMFPLDFLDPWFADLLRLLPFQYLAYFPAMVFLEMRTGPDLWWGLVVQAAWAVFFVVLARWLYHVGLRRYSAYGG